MKKIALIFLSTFVLFYSKAQVNLSANQVLYFNFNGNANDVSGNNNNGTVYGATLVTDKWGNPNGAYKFDGLNDYIEVVNNNAKLSFSNDSFSIYSLINVQGFYNGTCRGNYIVSRGTSDVVPGSFFSGYVDGHSSNHLNCQGTIDSTKENFYGSIASTGTINYPGVPTYIQKNNWYCVVTIGSHDSIRTYVDGVLEMAVERTGSAMSSSNIFVGRLNNFQFPYWVNGIIDEVRVYNRVINAQEISALCEYTQIPESVTDYSKIVKKALVFPNPANSIMNIDLTSVNEKVSSIQLFDISGKVIKNVTHEDNQQLIQMDLIGLAKGFYNCVIVLETGAEVHKVIIE